MQDLDLLIETAAVQGQLDTGVSPALVAARSSLGTRGVTVFSGSKSKRTKLQKWSRREDILLQSCLGILSDEEIGEALGRSAIAVHIRWNRELKLPAPSRRSDIITCQQIAYGLGIDGKTIALLIDRGILPGRRLPTARVIRIVDRITLLCFLVNPMNWICFDLSRINCSPQSNSYDIKFWMYARRLVQRKRELWEDDWWSVGQVAHYHGIDVRVVNKAIHRGRLPARRWGNWFVLKSHATDLRIQQSWNSKGQDHIEVSPCADAFLVLAEAVGLTHAEIGALMKWKESRVYYRLYVLHRQGRIPRIIEENLLSVYYDEQTGETFADWRMYRDLFPRLSRLMESLDTKPLRTPTEKRYVTRVQRKAAVAEKGI